MTANGHRPGRSAGAYVVDGAVIVRTLGVEAAVNRDGGGLPAAAVTHALATGRPAMVDRSLHRGPHLDEIDESGWHPAD